MLDLTFMDWGLLLALMLGLGAVAGFLAGLLGIGGGVVLVPGLFYVFVSLGFDPDVMMHVAVGTSLAMIFPTGLSSARTHHRKGNVGFDLVRQIGPGIIIGVLCGTVLAHFLSGDHLLVFFAVAIVCLAALMRINPEKFKLRTSLPPQPWSALVGAGVGTISSLIGVGGATMNVPFMTLCGIPIHKAIGSASALGLFIAIPGALGFMAIGLGSQNLPPFSLGFVNLLAFIIIMPISVLAAPLGAKTAHAVPVPMMRRIFSVFMIVVALKMLHEVFYG